MKSRDTVTKQDVYISTQRTLSDAVYCLSQVKEPDLVVIEKTVRSLYSLLKAVRNQPVEMHCLFVYWVLHEMLFDFKSIDSMRAKSAIKSVTKIADFLDMSVVDVATLVKESVPVQEPLTVSN